MMYAQDYDETLVLAKYFDSNERAYLNARSFLIAMSIIGAPVLLIMMQPDAGSALTFFSFFILSIRERLLSPSS